MCLSIRFLVPEADRSVLEAAVRQAPPDGLRVEMIHPPLWPWARRGDAEALVSEKGGCACSLLAEDADWDAEVWAMRPPMLGPLARTLSALAEQGPKGMIVEALWRGEKATREQKVTPKELGALALKSRLGTRTRYVLS